MNEVFAVRQMYKSSRTWERSFLGIADLEKAYDTIYQSTMECNMVNVENLRLIAESCAELSCR